MTKIEVQQLDGNGRAWRTFTYHVEDRQVDTKIQAIELAYNMNATRVIVSPQAS